MADLARLRAVVEPLLGELDVSLYDLEFSGGLLRVTLDRAGGVDLDTLAEANRRISRALDLEDPIPGRYTLEVTSPGLERPLRTAEHYRRALGERVRVKLRPGTTEPRRVDGVLIEVDDDAATLLTDDGAQRVPLTDVERARTVFVWGPAPKPGARKQAAPGTRPAAAPTSRQTSNPSEVS